MYHAMALVRLSTEEQATGNGRAGLLRQHEELRLAAARWNITIVDTIEIIDVSGTNVQASPLFQQLLERLKNPSLHGLAVPHLDRLMRPDDFASFGVYDFFLKQRKLIFTPSSIINVAEDSGFLQAGIESIMAGLDRKKILRMTQTAKEENRKRGRLANAKITLPQGVDFDFATGLWTWVEPWASRTRQAFALLLAGQHNPRQIAKQLGYANDRTLRNHLRNPIWTAWRVYTHKRGIEKYDGTEAGGPQKSPPPNTVARQTQARPSDQRRRLSASTSHPRTHQQSMEKQPQHRLTL
jgi:DNA invertase Pin-like site-specific DNA recombinase